MLIKEPQMQPTRLVQVASDDTLKINTESTETLGCTGGDLIPYNHTDSEKIKTRA